MLDENLKKSMIYTLLVGVIIGFVSIFFNKEITLGIVISFLALVIYIFILSFSIDNVVIGISSSFSYSLAYILRISALGGGLLASYKIGSLVSLFACFMMIVLFRIFLYTSVAKNKSSDNPKPYNENEDTFKE